MAGTRSSARHNSSPASEKTPAGTKRKADDTGSPSSSRSKKGRPSKQMTLEETVPAAGESGKAEDSAMGNVDGDAKAETNGHG
jgi:hypothetical protein